MLYKTHGYVLTKAFHYHPRYLLCSAFIGPLVGGVLYETIGFPWTATVFGFMILSAVSMTLSGFIYTALKRK